MKGPIFTKTSCSSYWMHHTHRFLSTVIPAEKKYHRQSRGLRKSMKDTFLSQGIDSSLTIGDTILDLM